MNTYCLASSSSGNCYLFTEGDTTLIVECGIPYNQIVLGALKNNVELENAKVLITHAHKDHYLAVDDLIKRDMKIIASEETLRLINKLELPFIEIHKWIKIANDIEIYAFPVNHDIQGSIGFIIKSKFDTILFVNDCKDWNSELPNVKYTQVYIEYNYDHKVVFPLFKELSDNDPKRFKLERQIKSHMSEAGCIRALKKLDLSECKTINLMHLSDGYSTPREIKYRLSKTISVPVRVCRKFGGLE